MKVHTDYATYALRFVAALHLLVVGAVFVCHLGDTSLGLAPTVVSFLLIVCALWLTFLSVYLSGSDQSQSEKPRSMRTFNKQKGL